MNELIKNETMTSLEIAEITGKRHADILEAIRNMEPAWEKVAQRKFPLGSYKDANNQDRPCYNLTKTECLYVATKFNDEARAKLILRWEELEAEKTTTSYYLNAKEDDTRARLAMMEGMKRVLNLSDSSTLAYAKKLFEPLGLPTPDYVPSKGILKSASELLKEHNAGISTQAFNKLAIKEGYLEEKTRKSSSGKDKSFKSITSKGEYFGENQVSPNNPKETQPSWYEDKFDELLKNLLGE